MAEGLLGGDATPRRADNESLPHQKGLVGVLDGGRFFAAGVCKRCEPDWKSGKLAGEKPQYPSVDLVEPEGVNAEQVQRLGRNRDVHPRRLTHGSNITDPS